MKPYSFLLEGPIGDNLRLKVAHAIYKNPSGGNPFTFWQNVNGLRRKYAKELLLAKSQGKEALAQKKYTLLKRTEDAINRYENEHGRLPDSWNPFNLRVRSVDLQ